MKAKNLSVLFMAAIFALSCNQEKDQSRMPKQYTAEQLRNNVSVFTAGFNKDDSKILIGSNQSGIYNIYLLNVADTTSRQLTYSTTNSKFPVGFLKGSDNFIFDQDEGGNENYHLYLQNINDTIAKNLTPWPGSTNSFAGWSLDKKSMYVTSNRRDPRFFDLLKIDTVAWKPEIIFRNDSAFGISGISHNERYIALTKSITTDKNELYLYDNQTKTYKRLSNDNEATWNVTAFEKNDSILYYTTNDNSEFSYIVKYNIHSGKAEKYFEDSWDVLGMSLSENEKYHTFFVNADGKNKLLVFDHAQNKPITFPEIADGDIQNVTISPSEKNMILSIGSSTSPSNIYSYNIAENKLKKLTSTLNKEVDENDLVKSEVVRYKSFDGLEIPAIYYKPLQASKKNKVPALVYVHGGPGGQSRVGFSNTIQFAVNKGYAVLAVNNRGSSGYGKTFYKMDNQKHGEGDLLDCIWGKKWLASQDYIDNTAIGIYGGSYGGNVVLNALTLHPDEFKVGVNLFGVSNWLRTLRSIPPYWEAFRKALYDEMGDPDSADSVRLKKISPLFNYEKITKPLLVFQGANDVRVLQIESDEIVAGVKKNGVPVEYVVYSDEGHGFIKKENQIDSDNKTLEFLEKYLRTQPDNK